jgi:hypothetical protein
MSSFIHYVPSPHRRLVAMDLQHPLSLALMLHSARLYFVHLLMSFSHLCLGPPFALHPSTFPSKSVLINVSCLFMWPKYFIFLIFRSCSSSLFIPILFRTLSLVSLSFHEIRPNLLKIHISNALILSPKKIITIVNVIKYINKIYTFLSYTLSRKNRSHWKASTLYLKVHLNVLTRNMVQRDN